MTKNTQIVAFTGKKGSGKDTAAEVLFDTGNWEHINFADNLKMICRVAYGLTYTEVYSVHLKQKELNRWPFKSPRFLLQEIAQLWRDKYPEIWVMSWLRAVKDSGVRRIVVTDLRYPNEVEALRSWGALIIMIHRPSIVDDEFSGHQSESHFDKMDADMDILNDGSIEDLHEKVKTALYSRRFRIQQG